MRGIQTLPTFGALLGAVTISTTLFDRSFVQPTDAAVLVTTAAPRPAAQRSLTNLVAGFPSAKVRTIDAYRQDHAGLDRHAAEPVLRPARARRCVVSLFGIVNTLALSIVERTREIGSAARDRNDTPATDTA